MYTTALQIENLVTRAFLNAYLLTASSKQAELAVTAALGLWNVEDGEEELLYRVLFEALQVSPEESGSAIAYLPAELRAVLQLPALLRRCYVLRVLAGLSLQSSTLLLQLDPDQVDQHTCAALQLLPAVAKQQSITADRAEPRWRVN